MLGLKYSNSLEGNSTDLYPSTSKDTSSSLEKVIRDLVK